MRTVPLRRTSHTIVTMILSMTATTIYGWQEFPLLHYDFSIDSCRQDVTITNTSSPFFVDYANRGTIIEGMGLIRNRNLTTCSLGMGIEVNQDLIRMMEENFGSSSNDSSSASSKSMTGSTLLLYSSQSIQRVKAALEADAAVATPSTEIKSPCGFTFSMWIKPLDKNSRGQDEPFNNQGVPGPILTVGPRIPTDNVVVDNQSGSLSPCDRNAFDFQLSYTDDHQLELIYRTSDRYFQPCQRIQYDTSRLWNRTGIPSTSIQHIAISMSDLRQEVFINGQSVARKRDPFDNTLKHWNESSVLQFFHHPVTSAMASRRSMPWNGRLFQFSMYSGVWEESQVKQVMSEGLPPSQPYALSKTVTILEDARNEKGELQQIVLPFLFVDREMDILLTSLGIGHQAPGKVRSYITRFPQKGKILDPISGRPIEQLGGNIPTMISTVNSLLYVPVQDEHSSVPGAAYTSFEFCVTTNRNVIFASSPCVSATISVVVDPVNDPPVALPIEPYSVHEGIHEEASALRLTGHDVDIDDSIVSIQITSPPRLGYLYLSVSSFRSQDSLLHGTLLSDINNTIPGREAYVEYHFTSYSEGVVQGSVIVDSFRFRVQDTKGSWSGEQVGEIHVLTSIATATEEFDDAVTNTVLGHAGTAISLKGVDMSGLNRTLGFFMDSIPTKGTVFDLNNARLHAGTIVQSGKSSNSDVVEVNVTYVPTVERCPDYHFYQNDSFFYRVIALDQNDQILSVSNATEQFIQVPCSIDTIELDFTVNETAVEAVATPLDHPCSGYSYNISGESNTSCYGSVIICSFHVEGQQKLAELALVSINSQQGLLTLNQKYLDEIRPLDDHQILRRRIRFLAELDRLNDIMSSLHFQSEVAGEDQIHVVVEYGRCNHNEVHLSSHDFSETGPDCMKVEKVLHVNIRSGERPSAEFLYRRFPWIPLPFTLCMLVFLKVRGKSREILLTDDVSTGCDTTIGIRWKQHYDVPSGFYYYEDLDNGEVTWEPPLDERFIPSPEGDGRSSHQPGEDHSEKKNS